MEISELQKYISAFGDCVALRTFCETRQAPETNTSLMRLRSRPLFPSKRKNDKTELGKVKKGYTKTTRTVTVGFTDFDGQNYVQRRSPTGGGIITLQLNKTATLGEIRQKAVDAFFPNGECRRLGPVSEFEIKIGHIDGTELDENMTVDEFNTNSLKRGHLYIITKHQRHLEKSNDNKDGARAGESSNIASDVTAEEEMSNEPHEVIIPDNKDGAELDMETSAERDTTEGTMSEESHEVIIQDIITPRVCRVGLKK